MAVKRACVYVCQNKMVSSVILMWQYWSLQDYQADEPYDKPGIHILLNDITRRQASDRMPLLAHQY